MRLQVRLPPGRPAGEALLVAQVNVELLQHEALDVAPRGGRRLEEGEVRHILASLVLSHHLKLGW